MHDAVSDGTLVMRTVQSRTVVVCLSCVKPLLGRAVLIQLPYAYERPVRAAARGRVRTCTLRFPLLVQTFVHTLEKEISEAG